jgi:hypothetical protein
MMLLPVLLVASGGCIPFPLQKDAKPPPAELAPPPNVKPDDVNATNAHKVLKQLEDEIKYDEEKQ